MEASTPQRTRPVIKKRERASKIVAKLRAKLRHVEEKVGKKTKQLLSLKRKIRRLEARSKSAIPRLPAKISQRARIREAKKRLPINSKRKQLGKIVSMFLHRDDVSTVINGKAGEICRKGQIYRKRALTDTLAKLHRRFLAEHPEQTVSKAQFFRLRPFWIIRPKVKDRETCACKMHENIAFKIKRMEQLGIIETSSPEDLVQSSVCDTGNMSCMYGRCQKCIEKTFPTFLDPLTQGNTVIWQEWITRSVTVTKTRKDGSTEERQTKKTFLEKRTSSIERLLALTTEHLPGFAVHMFNVKHQYLTLKAMKDTLTDDAVAVHVDYSENYSCKYAKEIKDTHFGTGNDQVTLHTGVLYLSRGRVEAFASLSDCLQHDAVATWAHLDPVLRYIRGKYPEAHNLHFISDGPTSQYRNKTSFYLASTVPFMHGFQWVTWNFTEASHGKGAPDGVGGALKNLADRIVSYGTSIPDAESLYEQLKNNSSVTLYKVSEEKIKASFELVPPNLKTVPGTLKIHQLASTKPGVIDTREVSCFCGRNCQCFSTNCYVFSEEGDEDPDRTEATIEVGQWVLVEYDGDFFPGTVTQIAEGQYEVDTMTCAGENRFYVPSIRFPGERVWYYRQDIRDIIPEPLPVTSSARHFCILPDIWAKHKKRS
ncbi:hypothetical protein QQF64_018460 [Cirrhinus molitorella]|uniref:Uncharacterized protein n=1 Tax=Cirrhinus molitorella TaxID=172907 RepID=A0ABR3LG40_9TELE